MQGTFATCLVHAHWQAASVLVHLVWLSYISQLMHCQAPMATPASQKLRFNVPLSSPRYLSVCPPYILHSPVEVPSEMGKSSYESRSLHSICRVHQLHSSACAAWPPGEKNKTLPKAIDEFASGQGTRPVLVAQLFSSCSLIGCQQPVQITSCLAQLDRAGLHTISENDIELQPVTRVILQPMRQEAGRQA